MENSGLMILLAIVLVGAVIAVAALGISFKSKPKLNVAKYQTRWLQVEHSLKRDTPESYQLAIMNADRLVDQALREANYKGKTMGERMKAAQSVWKNPNHVWGAHKVRNQLAHEADTQVTYEIAARSLVAFKQALKDLGAI